MQLYFDANKNGGFQYVFTLLRAEGITANSPDKVQGFYTYLQSTKQRLKAGQIDKPEEILNEIIDCHDVFSLLANLIKNALRESYRMYPLPIHFDKPFAQPDPSPKGSYIVALSELAKRYAEKNPEFHTLFEKIFTADVIDIFQEKKKFQNKKEALSQVGGIIDFLYDILKKYYRVLKGVNRWPKQYPSKTSFDVFEILTNEDVGLYGMIIHHSNGSQSFFKRYANRTEQMSYMFDDNSELIINIGGGGTERAMWMLNGRPFYETGFAGRYNPIGEWRPIVYPGSPDEIEKIIRDQKKDEKDSRVEGCLFYIMATCHHAIEFTVKANFEFPHEYLTASMSGGRVQLHKVTMSEETSSSYSDLVVYDGTMLLEKIDVESIRNALDAIGLFLNRISFRLDGKAEWSLKYKGSNSAGGKKSLSKLDFKMLGEYLMGLKSSDAYLIDTAISWYTSGKNAQNSFTKFLDYYIAIESLAMTLIAGEMDASKEYGIKIIGKVERKKRITECIKKLHDQEYNKDPVTFIERGYFECIKSLRSKTQLALETVFGKEHEFTKLFFDKSDGDSIYELRNKLAHGDFNHIDQAHAHLIQKKLHILEDIAYAFIMKLSMKKGEKFKKFNRFSLSIHFADPRATRVVSSLSNLPRKDWGIQWGWLS